MILTLLTLLPVNGWSADLRYKLDISVDTENQIIYGKARLNVKTNTSIELFIDRLLNMKINGEVLLGHKANKKISLMLKNDTETEITYEARFTGSESSLISKDYIFLMDHWYPAPDILAEYALAVTLPEDFIAISEAETVSISQENRRKTHCFHFKHPLNTLHLAASTKYMVEKVKHNNIAIETYFFKENAGLAQTYIEHTRQYLSMYEEMFVLYPYKRFAIVENILPTGYSMPTFTLLGRDIIKLPFIVKTSLGHEILHEWFGNFVYTDYFHGNWAEGITMYLSDYYYEALENRGLAYRKQIMLDYGAYVHPDNAIKIVDFQSGQNRAQRAVGYGKTAMVFHQLRERYGDNLFLEALGEFIKKNHFHKASWHDIQRAFEKTTGDKLYSYFSQWLNRNDLPDIDTQNAEIIVNSGQLLLKFDLKQENEPYSLRIPIAIHSPGGIKKSQITVNKALEKVVIPLDELPTEVILDEDYFVMRSLHNDETPPILASIMGAPDFTVVVSSQKHSLYKTLIDCLKIKNIIYIEPDKITMSMLKERSLLIAGFDNQISDMLLGKQEIPDDGVSLKVYKNPYNPSKRLLLVHIKNAKELKAAGQKISHYGKYSELAFNKGKNTHKLIANSKNGISVISRQAALAVRPDTISTIEDIMPEIIKNRIIYVGERHDFLSHHINQLIIIKKLHEKGIRFGVGMEMFQVSYQKPIDNYLASRIDERKFLEQTRYFEKWGFDYNLYKPVIDYLKENNIPLIALNIEGDISRKVAREGLVSLSGKQKLLLPKAMNLIDKQYREDIQDVFAMHGNQDHLNDFNNFLQAQIIWDEYMAETAMCFIDNNPDKKLVVLAGNGHIRNKYGIPERLFRRSREAYTVIVQDDEIKTGIADFVLLTTKIKGNNAPKLGVKIEEKTDTQDLEPLLTIAGILDNSPAMKAGLHEGDVIVLFDNQPVKDMSDLKICLFYCEAGDKIEIKIIRKGKTLSKEISLPDQTGMSYHFSMKRR